MNNLTDDNVEWISHIINACNIESAVMKEDLIDHFCCAIEEDMKKGLSFQNSYDKAYQNICPNGFDEIQSETVYLLTFKKIKAMKRLMYVSGYLSAIGITTTLFMKLNHLAHNQIPLILTTALLVFLFLPTLFFNQYKRELTKSIGDKLKYIFGYLGLVLLLVSVFFRISRMSGSGMIFFISIVLINFAFFPLLFYKMYRKSVE